MPSPTPPLYTTRGKRGGSFVERGRALNPNGINQAAVGRSTHPPRGGRALPDRSSCMADGRVFLRWKRESSGNWAFAIRRPKRQQDPPHQDYR